MDVPIFCLPDPSRFKAIWISVSFVFRITFASLAINSPPQINAELSASVGGQAVHSQSGSICGPRTAQKCPILPGCDDERKEDPKFILFHPPRHWNAARIEICFFSENPYLFRYYPVYFDISNEIKQGDKLERIQQKSLPSEA
jgi:hypothetical protein